MTERIRWTIEFEIVGEREELPEKAKQLFEDVHEDHLETVWFDGHTFYRYAGGGRGFYWVQVLSLRRVREG